MRGTHIYYTLLCLLILRYNFSLFETLGWDELCQRIVKSLVSKPCKFRMHACLTCVRDDTTRAPHTGAVKTGNEKNDSKIYGGRDT